jgi:nucleotide-binding universal stress UspA family protein
VVRPALVPIHPYAYAAPATAIVDAADATVDLVAMSSRGCEMSRLIAGSVDKEVICESALPILMCHTSTVEERAL